MSGPADSKAVFDAMCGEAANGMISKEAFQRPDRVSGKLASVLLRILPFL